MQKSGSNANSTEGVMLGLDGMDVFANGAFYVLGTPCTAIANSTTETSFFVGESPVTIGQPPNQSAFGSTRYMGPAQLNQGSLFKTDFWGTIANTGTPNLTIRFGLTNVATGTFNVLATTGAVAMTTTSGTVFFHVRGCFSIKAVGASGSIAAAIGCEYLATATTIMSPLTTTTIDLTQQYKLDILGTWSAASASNTMVLSCGSFELIG
jgi:hypothetical protein